MWIPYIFSNCLIGDIFFRLVIMYSKSSSESMSTSAICWIRPAISLRTLPYCTRSSSVKSTGSLWISASPREKPIGDGFISRFCRSVSKLPQKTKETPLQSMVTDFFFGSSLPTIIESPSMIFRNSFWIIFEKSVPPDATAGSKSLSASSMTTSKWPGFLPFCSSSRKISLMW